MPLTCTKLGPKLPPVKILENYIIGLVSGLVGEKPDLIQWRRRSIVWKHCQQNLLSKRRESQEEIDR